MKPKLEGLLFCEICSKPLTVKNGYYYCSRHNQRLRIKVELLDNEMIKSVHSRILTYVDEYKDEFIDYATKELISPLANKVRQYEIDLEKSQKKLHEVTSLRIENPSQYKTKEILKACVAEYKKCYGQLKTTKMKLEINCEKVKIALNKMLPIPTIQSLSCYKQKELIRFCRTNLTK